MSESDFYQEIAHTTVPWRRHELHVPVFYPDFLFMTISVLAPIKSIRSLLPSSRLKPYRITPWHSTLSITAYRYRESDIGPYSEISVGVPVTLDEETPLFTGSLRKMPKAPMVYIRHMPVTTEIAREVGAEFAGYPKFVASIEFTEEDNRLICELRADNRKVLTLSGRKLDLEHFPRLCLMPLTYRRGYVLRSEFVVSEREMGSSASGKNAKLELGEHAIAEELMALNLGKIVSYGYCPQAQGILTPVFESYAGWRVESQATHSVNPAEYRPRPTGELWQTENGILAVGPRLSTFAFESAMGARCPPEPGAPIGAYCVMACWACR